MVETRECLFCLRQSHIGIEVWGVFMCGSCENVLLQVPVGGERYMYFLEILKKAKQSCDIALNDCT